MINRKYGYRPDSADARDWAYKGVHRESLPVRVSLRDRMGPVFDQGELGSCTANALCGALGFLHPGFVGSRLFVYYGERVIEHDVSQDNGAAIRDGVKVLNKTGAPPETDWPYDIAKFAAKPPAQAYADAAQHKVSSYFRLTSRADFRNCLVAGFPFVIGFTVYQSFESAVVAKTGLVHMPGHYEPKLGGHAVCVIGYDSKHPHFGDAYEVRNSWGADWGDAGNFWVPARYFENPTLAGDAWTLRA